MACASFSSSDLAKPNSRRDQGRDSVDHTRRHPHDQPSQLLILQWSEPPFGGGLALQRIDQPPRKGAGRLAGSKRRFGRRYLRCCASPPAKPTA